MNKIKMKIKGNSTLYPPDWPKLKRQKPDTCETKKQIQTLDTNDRNTNH